MSDPDIGWRPIRRPSPTTPSHPATHGSTATNTTTPIPIEPPSPSPGSASARKRAGTKRGTTSRFGIHGLQSISNLRNGLSHARKSSMSSKEQHAGGGSENLLARNERLPTTRNPSLDSIGDGRTPLLQRSHNAQTSHHGGYGEKTTATSVPSLAVRPASIRIPFLDDPEVAQVCSPMSENTEQSYQLADTSDAVSGEHHVRPSLRTTTLGVQDAGVNAVQSTNLLGPNNTSVDLGTTGSVDLGRMSTESQSWPLNSTPVKARRMIRTSGDDGNDNTAARSPKDKYSTEVHEPPDENRTSTDKTRQFSHEYEPSLLSLINMQAQVAKLQAANAALLALNAAHEKTIAIHENTIACHAETIDSQEATIFRHEVTIADLNRELRFSDAERENLIENFGAEMANLNGENATLREDKWYLMGRVEELEQVVPKMKLQPTLGDERSTVPRVTLDDEVITLEGAQREDVESQGMMKSSIHDNASASLRSSSPAMEGQGTSNDDIDSPITSPGSTFSPRPCSGNSIRGVYAVTPTPSIGHVSSTKLIGTSDGCITRPSSRGQARVSSVLTGASKTEDGGARLSNELAESRKGTSMAPRSRLSARNRTSLEQDLATAQEKLAAAEEHNVGLQARTILQEALIRKLTTTSAAAVSVPTPSLLSVPNLPILTYIKPCSVWLDRVRTSFKYLGLIDFIQRDVPTPVTPGSTAAEIACWKSQRLQTVVLLKHAVDDDLLEDVLYLCGKDGLRACPTTTNSHSNQSSLLMEDPYRLFNTICTLRRAMPTSSSDLAWVDRIDSFDYEGLDGFASLVLCIDKRQSVMYGASVDHYDVLLPKIQESIARRFPDFKKTALALDSSDVLPKKRWQLSAWMTKTIKKRQAGVDV
ncbi:hypothetical protein M406DRAFT_68027 [Cryphonectria parasitica EP155]|uniref:Uncharacterized protein n=1 Tax=Cryphonectria parasitica (strain ATCC 38755 / EP155) TaxID=660469 RepID=A0A9P5CNL8_CRYP1|nr:uncharacterized protein M406DRAFT_68027 [Cryphonectria parasitica EP155]KAF3765604.1 hypothetical protein M406DRAFT_68027 [Cryphonectria parasitica EP155]